MAKPRNRAELYLKHIADVKADRQYGVMLGDGVTLASIENRWVRKTLHRQKKFLRRDQRQK